MALADESFGGSSRYCSSCGQGLRERDRFCPSCGSAVDARIAGTGWETSPDLVAEQYMGFWIRLAAEVIDYVILAIALIIVGALTTAMPWFWILLIPVIAYWVFKHLKCKTLGRTLFRIKVVNAAGEDVSFWRGALRETVGKFISALAFYLGFLWIGWDREKRGWHDHIAGTYVVRKKREPVL